MFFSVAGRQVKDVQPLYWLKAAFHDHISLPTTPATAKPLQVSSDAISQDRVAKLGLCYIFFRNTRRSWERKKQVLVCRVFGGAPLVPSNWVLNTDGGASITLDADPDPDLSKLSIMKEVDMIRSSHQSATSFWCRNGIQVTECCILVYDGKLFSAVKRGEQIIWNILKWSIFLHRCWNKSFCNDNCPKATELIIEQIQGTWTSPMLGECWVVTVRYGYNGMVANLCKR